MGYQDKLFSLRQNGVKFSLEPMQNLVAELGHPEKSLSFIHIAGTNGKGSVAAMCASIATAAGLKTGLYTSPHLLSYRERFQINGTPIPEDRLDQYLAFFEAKGWPGTFFEISTALALLYFRDEKTDLVIWETGLGGRLDATNVVTPKVSVVTSIGLDHTQLLGNTLEAIAGEKAGIIKPGVPVIASCRQTGALEVIRKRSDAVGSKIRVILKEDLGEFESPLLGEHQRWNTAVAVAAMRAAVPNLDDSAIRLGLCTVNWPGRAQWLQTEPRILLDGAHNTEAMQALAKLVPVCFGEQKIQLVFGAALDKELGAMSEILQGVRQIDSVILVPLPHERGTPVATLKEFFPEAESVASWSEAWGKIQEAGLPTLVTGSLFLVAEVLRAIEQPAVIVDAGELWKVH